MTPPKIIQNIERNYGLTFERVEIMLPEDKSKAAAAIAAQIQNFRRYGSKKDANAKYLMQQEKVIGLYLRSHASLTAFSFLAHPELRHLKALNLTENGLEELSLPASLQDLQYLDVSDNKSLQSLTFEASLARLKVLDASDSGLTEIYFPTGFKQLEKLDISRNKLASCILEAAMPHLELLDLSGNRLTTFTLLGGYEALKYLYLNKNQLTQVAFVTDLNRLKTLHLKSNRLLALPVKRYAHLETLYVAENPLKEYPENLVKGDASGNAVEIIGLLRATAASGEGKNYTARLIVVGNGRIGKTCMVNRLKGGTFNEYEEYTHGISIQQLSKKDLPNVKTKKLDLRVWDFGGQEVFYATHQFFLSEESAYVYAWTDEAIAKANREKDLKKSPTLREERWRKHDYWLENIRMHGKDSPIQIVKTHCLTAKTRLPYEHLKKKFELKKEPVDFDAKSLEPLYLSNLKKSLTAIIDQLPHLDGPLPNSYITLIDRLKKERERGIAELSKARFWKDLARPAKIIETDFDNLLGYLKKTGEIIYFPNNEKLARRIFIDPQKLTQRIYKLIENNDFLIAEEGEFNAEHAKEKLGQTDWEIYLELLISFDLVFKKKMGDAEQYIAPQYLKKLPASGKAWRAFHALKQERKRQFSLHYPRFLPENVMINVLSNYGPYSNDLIYRNGIYFKKADHSEGCVIECEEAKRRVEVYTKDNPEGWMIAREVFDKFHTLSKKAKIHIFNPVDAKPVDYKSLLAAIAQNREYMPTTDGLDMIRIDTFGFLHSKEFLPFAGKSRAFGFEVKRPRPTKNIIEVEMMVTARTFIPFKDPRPIKLLFLSATPMNQGQINTGNESRFKDKIKEFDEDRRIRFREEHGISTEKFADYLFTDDPHIVHYGGHGSREGIFLQDKELDAAVLIELLEDSDNTQCVVLNACDSLEIAKKVAQYIPYVVATCDKIEDEVAIAFARGFYVGIAGGKKVEQSFRHGLRTIKNAGLTGGDVLVLVKGVKPKT